MADLVFRIKADNKELIDALRKSQSAAEVTGKGIEKALDSGAAEGLTDELENTEAQLEDVAVAADDVTTGFDEGTAAVGRQKKEIRDVKDIIESLDGPMADMILKWGGAFAATVVASKAIGELADQVKEVNVHLGASEESAAVFSGLLHDMAAPWNVILGKSEGYAAWLQQATTETAKLLQGTQDQANAQEILAKFTEQHQKALEGVKATTESIAEIQKQATGFSLAELKTELTEILHVSEELRKQDLLKEGPFADAVRDRVEKATKAVEAYGESAKDSFGADQIARLKALREQLTVTTEDTKKLEDAQKDAAKQTARVSEALEDEIRSLKKLSVQYTEVESDLLDGTAKVKDALDSAFGSESSDQIDDIKESIADLRREEEEIARAALTTEEQQQRRFEIASLLADKLRELTQAERDFHSAGASGFKEQEEAQRLFRQVLDEAAKQIEALPEDTRAGADAIIAKWKNLNENIVLSRGRIEDFETEFSGAMANSRLGVASLGDRTKAELEAIRALFGEVGENAVSFVNDMATAFTSNLHPALESTKNELAEIVALLEKTRDTAVEAI